MAWDLEYYGNSAVPTEATPTWTQIFSGNYKKIRYDRPDGEGPNNSFEVDCLACGNEKASWYRTPDINFSSGFTVEILVRVIQAPSTGTDSLKILLQDGTADKMVSLKIGEDEVLLSDESGNTDTYTMDTTDGFHTYKIQVSGTTATLFIDAIERASLTVGSSSVDDRIEWGVMQATNNSTFLLKYLKYAINQLL